MSSIYARYGVPVNLQAAVISNQQFCVELQYLLCLVLRGEKSISSTLNAEHPLS